MSRYYTTTAQISSAPAACQTRPAITTDAIPPLLKLLNNPDAEIAAGAAEQLARLGVQALPALIAELEGRGLRAAGKALICALLPAQAQAVRAYRQRIEDVLASFGPEAAPALRDTLSGQPSPQTRASLERALARCAAR